MNDSFYSKGESLGKGESVVEAEEYKEGQNSNALDILNLKSENLNKFQKDYALRLYKDLIQQMPSANPFIVKDYDHHADYVTNQDRNPNREYFTSFKFYSYFDLQVQQMLNRHDKNLIYVGYRPKNDKQFIQQIEKDSQFQKYQQKTKKQIKPITDNSIKITNNFGNLQVSRDNLQFDSNFETGNLDYVTKISNTEYYLYMRCDTNTEGNQSWFNFKTKNNLQTTYKFKILNFQNQYSLYQFGMKIFARSKKSKEKWSQKGESLVYRQEYYQGQVIYTLSFEYTFEFENDDVQFARCIPYGYSDLMEDLDKMKQNNPGVFNFSVLCKTLSGLDCPLITITNQNQNADKKVVLLSARIHPSESNSSFIMKGLLKSLVSASNSDLLSKVVFKIIPMINIDGVIVGNSRADISGLDLNRQFKVDQLTNTPVVSAIIKLAKQLKLIHKDKFVLFLDFHGHSLKKNSFSYGPYFDADDVLQFKLEKLFLSQIAPQTNFDFFSQIQICHVLV